MFDASWRCIPTRTFSSAVMFWNSRMFWNVRPIPAATTSFGRALRRMPSRARSVVYQAGRMVATTRVTTSATAHEDCEVTTSPSSPALPAPRASADERDEQRRARPTGPTRARPGAVV